MLLIIDWLDVSDYRFVCSNLYFMKAADVPCWMFIAWINQMLAVLDKREGRAVHTILQEIAQTYPQVRDILHTIA